MNKIYLLILIFLISCDDNSNEISNSSNHVSFENPEVGQKSIYIGFTGTDYFTENTSWEYTQDSVIIEITEIESGVLTIKEQQIFSSSESNIIEYYYQIEVVNNKLFFDLNGQNSSIFYSYSNDSNYQIDFNLPEKQASTDGWKIESDSTSQMNDKFDIGFFETSNGKFLNVKSDRYFEPMAVDGPGSIRFYNKTDGILKLYSINPWFAQASGFELTN